MKASEIKELSEKEIQERISAEVAQLANMKLNHSISPLDNSGQIKDVRRNIARLKTELRRRELNK
jgi:large subunit ribosomal protein L29